MQPSVGIGLKCLAVFVFSIMGALIKSVSGHVPTGEIVFARSFFGIFPLLVLPLYRGTLLTVLATSRPGMHIIRSLVGSAAMFCFFAALALISLPDLTAITYAAPLLVVVLAVIILGEKVRLYRWTAVIVGLVGVLIILYPRLGLFSSNGIDAGTTFAIAGTLLMAVATILVRQLVKTEKTEATVFYFSASATIFALMTIPFGWVMPDLKTAIILVLIGLFGGVAQMLLTRSYFYAEASVIAPFDYTSMIWAVLIGYFVFGDVPAMNIIVGCTIVMTAGIFIILRESNLGILNVRARKARTPSGS